MGSDAWVDLRERYVGFFTNGKTTIMGRAAYSE